jgi:hypothetical protein
MHARPDNVTGIKRIGIDFLRFPSTVVFGQ